MRFVRFFCLMILLMTGFESRADDGGTMVIATGPRGSDTYSTAGTLCRSINRITAYQCSVLETSGSIESMYALELLDADFAIVQQDIERAAWGGTTQIPGKHGKLRPVMPLYTMSMTIVTRADSAISSFRGLAGKRVATGAPLSGSRWTFRAVLDEMMVPETERPIIIDIDARDGMALCNGSLDAVVMVTGHPSLTVARMADLCAIRIVPLEVDVVRALSAAKATYRPMSVPPGFYPFAPQPVPTIGTDAMLVALKDTPDEAVLSVLRAVFTDAEVAMRRHRTLALRPGTRIYENQARHRAAKSFFGIQDATQ